MGDIYFQVIFATKNSNRFHKTKFQKEKLVENVVTLGPIAQATLVYVDGIGGKNVFVRKNVK